MARLTSTTADSFRPLAIRRRLGRGLVVVAALLLAGFGWATLRQIRSVDGWVRTADRLRSGDQVVPPSDVARGIAQLEAIPDPSADMLGALTFLHYAAAEDALLRSDRTTWLLELANAAERARQALALSPGRADVAVALAEVEFLLSGPSPGVFRALELSYHTAPRELWIAQRRIGLGLRLLAVAPPDIADHVISDVRILGEPFRDTDRYRILAQAAFAAGPAATAMVERELGGGQPWPFMAFEKYLAQYRRAAGD